MNLKLRELRKAKDLNQSELAEMVGVTTRVVGAWERRDTQITLEDAVSVSIALGCTPNDLCGWYDSHPREGEPDPSTPEGELMACYRASTPDRRERILGTARDAALLSGEDAERRVAEEASA